MLTLADGEARSKRGTPTSSTSTTSTAERLLSELAELAQCRPEDPVLVSVDELARRMRVSVRTVQRARHHLAQSGRVRVEPSVRRYEPNRYILVA